jgi:hypothetical protein
MAPGKTRAQITPVQIAAMALTSRAVASKRLRHVPRARRAARDEASAAFLISLRVESMPKLYLNAPKKQYFLRPFPHFFFMFF